MKPHKNKKDNKAVSINGSTWTKEKALERGYSGLCPKCGELTINCVVADDACINIECDYVSQGYPGTIYV